MLHHCAGGSLGHVCAVIATCTALQPLPAQSKGVLLLLQLRRSHCGVRLRQHVCDTQATVCAHSGSGKGRGSISCGNAAQISAARTKGETQTSAQSKGAGDPLRRFMYVLALCCLTLHLDVGVQVQLSVVMPSCIGVRSGNQTLHLGLTHSQTSMCVCRLDWRASRCQPVSCRPLSLHASMPGQ